jgi:hypothetical protein
VLGAQRSKLASQRFCLRLEEKASPISESICTLIPSDGCAEERARRVWRYIAHTLEVTSTRHVVFEPAREMRLSVKYCGNRDSRSDQIVQGVGD